MGTYKAVYSRYGGRYFEDCDTLEEAVRYLSFGADYGALFQVCIVEPSGKVLTEADAMFEIVDDIPKILNLLHIPYTEERGTFVMVSTD